MDIGMSRGATALAPFLFLLIFVSGAWADPLPSWNEGPVKTAIIDFVDRVTTFGTADYVPEEERIATFEADLELTLRNQLMGPVSSPPDL